MNPRRIIAIVLVLLLSACSNWDDPRKARAQRAATATGDIVIGAAWPWDGDKGNLWQGIELAVAEINAEGGVLKRQLRIVKENDESSLAKGRLIAGQFADNPEMVAVIGHLDSYIALPAAAVYQAAGLLYLSPGASDYQINSRGDDLVFRSVPSNRRVGQQMAEQMAARGYRRVAIYYVKDKAHQNLANYFEQGARDLGMSIADRRSYAYGGQDFSRVIEDWQDLYQFDALFLTGRMPEVGLLIAQARKMGLTVPIFGGEGLDTTNLQAVAGSAAEGVLLPEIFLRDPDWPAYRHFSEIFTLKYGSGPDTSAAQGYDAVHLLAQAIRRADSSVPEKIAAALHQTKKWPGAGGEFTFDEKGDIPDKKMGLKTVRDGRFETVR